jgi:hypothetical protein
MAVVWVLLLLADLVALGLIGFGVFHAVRFVLTLI